MALRSCAHLVKSRISLSESFALQIYKLSILGKNEAGHERMKVVNTQRISVTKKPHPPLPALDLDDS